MPGKKKTTHVRLKKHSAPAATADEIRRAAGISDKKMRQITQRLRVHGLIKPTSRIPRPAGTSRKAEGSPAR